MGNLGTIWALKRKTRRTLVDCAFRLCPAAMPSNAALNIGQSDVRSRRWLVSEARRTWAVHVSVRVSVSHFLMGFHFLGIAIDLGIMTGSQILWEKRLSITRAQDVSYRLQQIVGGKWPLQHGVRP